MDLVCRSRGHSCGFSPFASEGGYPSLYRPRNVRATALYQLLETYYERVKALWEDRFEKKYGFWRGFVDTVVARYLTSKHRAALRKSWANWIRRVHKTDPLLCSCGGNVKRFASSPSSASTRPSSGFSNT